MKPKGYIFLPISGGGGEGGGGAGCLVLDSHVGAAIGLGRAALASPLGRSAP